MRYVIYLLTIVSTFVLSMFILGLIEGSYKEMLNYGRDIEKKFLKSYLVDFHLAKHSQRDLYKGELELIADEEYSFMYFCLPSGNSSFVEISVVISGVGKVELNEQYFEASEEIIQRVHGLDLF